MNLFRRRASPIGEDIPPPSRNKNHNPPVKSSEQILYELLVVSSTTPTDDDIYPKIQQLLLQQKDLVHGIIHSNSNNGDWNSNMKRDDYNDDDGKTPLHLICSSPKHASNLKLIKLLINTSSSLSWHNEGEQNTSNQKNSNTNNRRKNSNTKNNTDFTVSSYDEDGYIVPTPAKAVRQVSTKTGSVALHYACRNAAVRVSIDVIEYLIACHPAAVCTPNTILQNLPLHEACMAVASASFTSSNQGGGRNGGGDGVPIELILLLIQKWPESCQIPNIDGNLPLHLACHIYRYNYQQSTATTQLDIIQYIANYYPDALYWTNRNGQTPIQIAKITITNVILGLNDELNVTNIMEQHPIVKLLQDYMTTHNSSYNINPVKEDKEPNDTGGAPAVPVAKSSINCAGSDLSKRIHPSNETKVVSQRTRTNTLTANGNEWNDAHSHIGKAQTFRVAAGKTTHLIEEEPIQTSIPLRGGSYTTFDMVKKNPWRSRMGMSYDNDNASIMADIDILGDSCSNLTTSNSSDTYLSNIVEEVQQNVVVDGFNYNASRYNNTNNNDDHDFDENKEYHGTTSDKPVETTASNRIRINSSDLCVAIDDLAPTHWKTREEPDEVIVANRQEEKTVGMNSTTKSEQRKSIRKNDYNQSVLAKIIPTKESSIVQSSSSSSSSVTMSSPSKLEHLEDTKFLTQNDHLPEVEEIIDVDEVHDGVDDEKNEVMRTSICHEGFEKEDKHPTTITSDSNSKDDDAPAFMEDIPQNPWKVEEQTIIADIRQDDSCDDDVSNSAVNDTIRIDSQRSNQSFGRQDYEPRGSPSNRNNNDECDSNDENGKGQLIDRNKVLCATTVDMKHGEKVTPDNAGSDDIVENDTHPASRTQDSNSSDEAQDNRTEIPPIPLEIKQRHVVSDLQQNNNFMDHESNHEDDDTFGTDSQKPKNEPIGKDYGRDDDHFNQDDDSCDSDDDTVELEKNQAKLDHHAIYYGNEIFAGDSKYTEYNEHDTTSYASYIDVETDEHTRMLSHHSDSVDNDPVIKVYMPLSPWKIKQQQVVASLQQNNSYSDDESEKGDRVSAGTDFHRPNNLVGEQDYGLDDTNFDHNDNSGDSDDDSVESQENLKKLDYRGIVNGDEIRNTEHDENDTTSYAGNVDDGMDARPTPILPDPQSMDDAPELKEDVPLSPWKIKQQQVVAALRKNDSYSDDESDHNKHDTFGTGVIERSEVTEEASTSSWRTKQVEVVANFRRQPNLYDLDESENSEGWMNREFGHHKNGLGETLEQSKQRSRNELNSCDMYHEDEDDEKTSHALPGESSCDSTYISGESNKYCRRESCGSIGSKNSDIEDEKIVRLQQESRSKTEDVPVSPWKSKLKKNCIPVTPSTLDLDDEIDPLVEYNVELSDDDSDDEESAESQWRSRTGSRGVQQNICAPYGDDEEDDPLAAVKALEESSEGAYDSY